MHVSQNVASKTSSTLISLMMVLSVLLVGATPTVSAVGPNQSDMGMASGDPVSYTHLTLPTKVTV